MYDDIIPPVSVSRIDWTVQARLDTRIGFMYSAVFDPEFSDEKDAADALARFLVDYPTLSIDEGEWDEADDASLPQAITLTGQYSDLVRWVLECGEYTEIGMAQNIMAIEVLWDTAEETVTTVL